jgi:hypothetical protein
MACNINNKSDFNISEIEDLFHDLYSFSSNRFGFKKDAILNLVSDAQNTSPLGKTAYYDPSSMEITIYVDNRHPKDIMRSFSHELVHHDQNLRGEFANIVGQGGSNYAQTNPHLRKMEKEAYLKGNMCFRDWEDGYKSSNPNILNERRIYKMSIKDWKDKELNTLLNEKWGFSMDLNKLNENKKPDFPDVDGDGDREEPISQAQKDKKAKGGNDKPKKKAKKGEIPPQLKNHVKGKKKDSDEKEELEEINMGVRGGLGKTPKSETDAAKKQSDKNHAHMKKEKDNKKTKTMKEAEGDITIGQRLQQVTAIRDALRKGIMQDTGINIPAEKMAGIIDMVIDAAAQDGKSRTLGYKKFSKMPPKKGGGSDGGQGGAPAQVQEQKLRKAIRKIINQKNNESKNK